MRKSPVLLLNYVKHFLVNSRFSKDRSNQEVERMKSQAGHLIWKPTLEFCSLKFLVGEKQGRQENVTPACEAWCPAASCVCTWPLHAWPWPVLPWDVPERSRPQEPLDPRAARPPLASTTFRIRGTRTDPRSLQPGRTCVRQGPSARQRGPGLCPVYFVD